MRILVDLFAARMQNEIRPPLKIFLDIEKKYDCLVIATIRKSDELYELIISTPKKKEYSFPKYIEVIDE